MIYLVNVGVIAEYNPFHNGHLYHLNKVKEMFPNSNLILILTGNFTQRGEISIINKWDKTKIALDYGFDLVVELPFCFATESARVFAKGSIDILNLLNCNYLVFGSESNNINLLKELASLTYNNELYDKLINKYSKKGVNYPTACFLALKDITGKEINKPNDILAFEYIKRIMKINSNIIPISIKRTNSYHENKINSSIASATAIRKNINDTNAIKKVIPNNVLKYITKIDHDKYFNLLKYEILTNNNLSQYIDVSEGIENKLKKEIINCNNLNELILKIKSKRYSYTKLSRMLLHIICKLKKDENYKDLRYLRILGLSNNGKKIIKECKNNINIPIITKYKKEYNNLFKTDYKANLVYSLITNYDIKNEFRSSIKKD